MNRGARSVLAALAAVCLSQWLIACGGGSGDGAAPPTVVTCPATGLPSGAASTTLAVAGWPDRDYDLVLPASYQCGQPIAVAIVFHGGGGNKANMRQTACPGGDLASADCIDRIALAAGMAVVFPNGTKVPGSDALTPGGIRTWNAGGGHNGYNCVSGNACNNGVDDIAYVRALVADIGTHIAVDGKRTFASGFSNGAALTQRLACQAADLFAAIAPVSGENQYAVDGCAPTQRVAVLDIHGTADGCWPYAGGVGGCIDPGLYVSVGTTLAGWAGRNGCAAIPTLATLAPLPGVNDGTSVVRQSYAGCGNGGDLEHLQVVGGGHYWSRGYSFSVTGNSGGVMSQQLDTSQAVVDFFVAHGRA
jgi:polyhydroxybutyrate depolymerase